VKSKTKVLAALAMLGASFVLTGCPSYHRPHAPLPHRLPHPRLPFDSQLQPEPQVNAPLAARNEY